MIESTSDSTSVESAPASPAGEQAEPASSAALAALLGDISGLTEEARAAFAAATDLRALEDVRLAFLGKKGKLAEANQRFGSLSPEEKPIAGKNLNNHKAQIIHLHKERLGALEAEELNRRLEGEAVDVTLPGIAPPRGRLHPVERVVRDIEATFRALGFRVTESPEIETEWVNFDALNMPADHPARDMQDTFFLDRGGRVLRTHTSGNQIRTMLGGEPPMAALHIGKVYRCDDDVTHSPMFFQMEGFMIDKNISMAHLKGVLNEFVKGMYGKDAKTRFRPSFFPFTEPSAEMDMSCVVCGGKDRACRVCSGTGWLEILGCGMIHPQVLRNGGIDPEQWSGFAFGLGLDRITMLKFGINDIRLLYENDLRFLGQF